MATFYLGPLDVFMNGVLNCLRNTSHPGITPYFGLIVSGPSDSAGTGLTELVHADYATRLACGFGAPALRQIANTGAITLKDFSSSQWNGGAAIKRFGLFSAPTGGVCHWVEEISPPLIVAGSGVPVIIPASAMIFKGPPRTGTE